MKTRRWLVSLLLLLGLGCCSPLHAAARERPSHRPIDTNLGDDLKPEDLLAGRLRGSRDWLKDKELQEWAKDVLKNPKAREQLQKLLKNHSDEKIQRLLKDFDPSKPIDPELLKELIKANKDGNGLKIDENLVKRFKELQQNGGLKVDPSKPPVPDLGKMGQPPRPPRLSGPMPPNPKPQPWDKPDKSGDWFPGTEKYIKKWIESASSKSLQDSFQRLSKARQDGTSKLPKFGEHARGLARHLPKVSNWLPKNITAKPPEPRLPSLPNLGLSGLPSMPGTPAAPGARTGKAILWVIVLGVLAVVLWRTGGWWKQHQAARQREWRLGPWPVRPGEVSTRADLVRAFEHLALMCLGPAARTCHHLELGGRIGEQPALDPDRRRDAAGTLARLYEQARYTPDEEQLPPETMASARRELCYLAGVVPV